MKKHLIEYLTGGLFILLILILVTLAMLVRPGSDVRLASIGSAASPNTQKDVAEFLQTQLLERGVPVNAVKVLSNDPLQVEVVLKSPGGSDQLTDEDNWNLFLSKHEVELAYLSLGVRVKSFQFTVLNPQGTEIYRTYGNILSDFPSQQITQALTPAIGDQETSSLLMQELDLRGMKLISLDVKEDYPRENTKYVRMELSAVDLPPEKISDSVTGFLGSSQSVIEELNLRQGTQITLLQVHVIGPQGDVIAHYILDLDLQSQSVRLADGINAYWLPSPVISETQSIQPAPQASSTPPVPTAAPPQSPYP